MRKSRSWDEWVPETRLLKWEDSNIKLQKSLIEAQRAKDRAEKEAAKLAAASSSLDSGVPRSLSSAGGGRSSSAVKEAAAASSSGALASAGGARGTKRGRDSLLVDEEEYKTKPEVKIVIPDLLKVKLVDDWEAITKNYQVGDNSQRAPIMFTVALIPSL